MGMELYSLGGAHEAVCRTYVGGTCLDELADFDDWPVSYEPLGPMQMQFVEKGGIFGNENFNMAEKSIKVGKA